MVDSYCYGSVAVEMKEVFTLDGDLLALEVVHITQEHFLPVAAVADEAQIG